MSPETIAVLKPLLWDVDAGRIDLSAHRRWLIERVLGFGRPEQVRWLLSTYDIKDIAETVRRSRSLDKRTANYWALHLNIPQKDVRCLNRR